MLWVYYSIRSFRSQKAVLNHHLSFIYFIVLDIKSLDSSRWFAGFYLFGQLVYHHNLPKSPQTPLKLPKQARLNSLARMVDQLTTFKAGLSWLFKYIWLYTSINLVFGFTHCSDSNKVFLFQGRSSTLHCPCRLCLSWPPPPVLWPSSCCWWCCLFCFSPNSSPSTIAGEALFSLSLSLSFSLTIVLFSQRSWHGVSKNVMERIKTVMKT